MLLLPNLPWLALACPVRRCPGLPCPALPRACLEEIELLWIEPPLTEQFFVTPHSAWNLRASKLRREAEAAEAVKAAEAAAEASEASTGQWRKVSLSKINAVNALTPKQRGSVVAGDDSPSPPGSSKWGKVNLSKLKQQQQQRGSVVEGGERRTRRGSVAAQEAAAELVKKIRMEDVVAWFHTPQEQSVQVETLERLSAGSINPDSTELLEQLILGLLRGADKPGKEAMLLACLGRFSGDELAKLLREYLNNCEGAEAL